MLIQVLHNDATIDDFLLIVRIFAKLELIRRQLRKCPKPWIRGWGLKSVLFLLLMVDPPQHVPHLGLVPYRRRCDEL